MEVVEQPEVTTVPVVVPVPGRTEIMTSQAESTKLGDATEADNDAVGQNDSTNDSIGNTVAAPPRETLNSSVVPTAVVIVDDAHDELRPDVTSPPKPLDTGKQHADNVTPRYLGAGGSCTQSDDEDAQSSAAHSQNASYDDGPSSVASNERRDETYFVNHADNGPSSWSPTKLTYRDNTKRFTIDSSSAYSCFGAAPGGTFGGSRPQKSTKIQRQESLPGPGCYNIEPQRSERGGLFKRGKTRGVELVEFALEHGARPGPSSYNVRRSQTDRGTKGGKWSCKSRWEESVKETPGPATYNMPEVKPIGGKMAKGKRQSFTDDAISHGVPDPGSYDVSLPKPRGGRMGISDRKNFLDNVIQQKRDIPGPGAYKLKPRNIKGGVIMGKPPAPPKAETETAAITPAPCDYGYLPNSMGSRTVSTPALKEYSKPAMRHPKEGWMSYHSSNGNGSFSGGGSKPVSRSHSRGSVGSRGSSVRSTPRGGNSPLNPLFRERSILKQFGIRPSTTLPGGEHSEWAHSVGGGSRAQQNLNGGKGLLRGGGGRGEPPRASSSMASFKSLERNPHGHHGRSSRSTRAIEMRSDMQASGMGPLGQSAPVQEDYRSYSGSDYEQDDFERSDSPAFSTAMSGVSAISHRSTHSPRSMRSTSQSIRRSPRRSPGSRRKNKHNLNKAEMKMLERERDHYVDNLRGRYISREQPGGFTVPLRFHRD